MGRHNHPEISMHTHPLARYMKFVDKGDWAGVAELMLDSGRKLAGCGAEFLITPDNLIHQAMPQVLAQPGLPWLNIAEEVVAEAKRRGFQRLGIMGTRPLVEGPVYPEALQGSGIEYRLPSPLDRGKIHQTIFDELVNGDFRSESLVAFRLIIERLKSEGCDAVVLGCTEIPLLVTPETSPLPTLDSTRILARAALQRATGSAA